MKKAFIIILFCFFCSFFTEAQNHLKFMGISMGGDINSFVNSLVQKGFRVDYTGKHRDWNNVAYEDWATLSGPFWDFDWVDIVVQAPYEDGGVSYVEVNGNGTRSNREQFERLIKSLDKKYGRHKVQRDHIAAGDYLYTWNLSNGTIQVWKSVGYNSEDGKCNLDIRYNDKPRMQRKVSKKRKHANDL